MPRLPRECRAGSLGANSAPREARIYIRPLGEPEPVLPRRFQVESLRAHGKTRNVRTFIRPLGGLQVLRLSRRFQAESPGDHGARRDAKTYIKPLGKPEVPHLPQRFQAERSQNPRFTKGRQGRKSDPLVSSKCRACLTIPNKELRNPRCINDRLNIITPLDQLQVPPLPRKIQSESPKTYCAARDARMYIRPLEAPEVPHLPCKFQAKNPGAHGAPWDGKEVYRTPWKP